jgi:hypothetical protein
MGWTIGVLGFDSRRGLGILLFTIPSRTALGPTQPPVQWVPGAVSLGIKLPGREADHSAPSSAEVKEWVELYLHSPYTPPWRGARLKEKHRDNFTFTFSWIHKTMCCLGGCFSSLQISDSGAFFMHHVKWTIELLVSARLFHDVILLWRLIRVDWGMVRWLWWWLRILACFKIVFPLSPEPTVEKSWSISLRFETGIFLSGSQVCPCRWTRLWLANTSNIKIEIWTWLYTRAVWKVCGLVVVGRCCAVMPPSAYQRRTTASLRTFKTTLEVKTQNETCPYDFCCCRSFHGLSPLIPSEAEPNSETMTLPRHFG